jgi:peptidyl-prolyl cis-trans isomerase C
MNRFGTVTYIMLGFLFTVALLVTCHAQDVLAVIGDRKITESDLKMKLEEIPAYARANFETKEGKLKLLDRLVRTELLKRAAIDAGYEDLPEIKIKLEDSRERILTSEYFKIEMSKSSEINKEKVAAYYEANKSKYKTESSAEISHILFESEDQAREVHGKLLKGELAFEEAVKTFSKDEPTKDKGGSLGEVRKGGFTRGIGHSEDFDKAVFALKEGSISEPIKTRLGWHIIKINKMTTEGYKPLSEVEKEIADELLVTDAEVEKEYKAHPENYKTRAKIKIKHIQVADESLASDIYKQLTKGAAFDDLVQKYSTDTASVKQTGNLGYLYEDGYVRGIGKDPDFEKAVFKLDEGTFSKPLKTKKGWHIVMATEKTDESLKPLIDVKTEIRSKLMRDAKEREMENRFSALKEKYKCKVYEDRVTGTNGE